MVPPFEEFMLPVLRVLKDGQIHDRDSVKVAIVSQMNLSEDDMAEKTRSGNKLQYEDRVEWSLTYLYQAGLLTRPKRGFYQLTSDGVNLLVNPPKVISRDYLFKNYASFQAFMSRQRKKDENEPADIVKEEAADYAPKLTYEEALATIQNLNKINVPIPEELLQIVKQHRLAEISAPLISGFDLIYESMGEIKQPLNIALTISQSGWKAKLLSEQLNLAGMAGDDISQDEEVGHDEVARKRRPNINYYEVGLVDGDELVFVNDPSVKAVVCGRNKVTYNGENFSLTSLTQILLGREKAMQPTSYWLFEERNLQDLYDETYPKS